MNDALDRVKAARMIERVRQQRASVTAAAGGAGGAVTVEPVTEEPCTECEEQGEVLQSPDPAVVDGPITAAATMVRNAIVFPSAHFDAWDADAKDQTPLTFEPDGRIYGHIAGTVCYKNGDMSACKRYQRDPDPKLRNFHTWTTTLDDGRVIRTGALTAAALHADVRQPLEVARAYHENTSTVVARVRAWEDSRGRLAVAGSVVPGLPDAVLGQVAGAPVSIEQWPTMETGGRNTLTAAHLVVDPAWPVITA
jgi:hypothetical protein